MNASFVYIPVAGGLFLLVFFTGYSIARAGKPYPLAIFTIHKLLALAAVIFLSISFPRLLPAAPPPPGQYLAAGITALCLVALFVTGGLLSIEKTMPALVRKLHKTLPYLAVMAIGINIYLLTVP